MEFETKKRGDSRSASLMREVEETPHTERGGDGVCVVSDENGGLSPLWADASQSPRRRSTEGRCLWQMLQVNLHLRFEALF